MVFRLTGDDTQIYLTKDISGPLEGAYTTLGDKTPDEKGEGEE